MIEWLAITLLVTMLVYAIAIYNRLVRDRQMTLAGWSDIGVQLKRRHDLIPKLIDAVRNLNTRIESFPDLLLARLSGFVQADYFEFEESLSD